MRGYRIGDRTDTLDLGSCTGRISLFAASLKDAQYSILPLFLYYLVDQKQLNKKVKRPGHAMKHRFWWFLQTLPGLKVSILKPKIGLEAMWENENSR